MSLFLPKNLVSQDRFDRPVPRPPAHSPKYSGCIWCLLTGFLPISASSRFPPPRPFIYSNHHTPPGQTRVYPVKQLRTYGVHCQAFAGTGPVVLKVVPLTGAPFASPWTNYCAPLFSHTHYWYEVGMLKVGLQLAGYSWPNSVNEGISLLKKKL